MAQLGGIVMLTDDFGGKRDAFFFAGVDGGPDSGLEKKRFGYILNFSLTWRTSVAHEYNMKTECISLTSSPPFFPLPSPRVSPPLPSLLLVYPPVPLCFSSPIPSSSLLLPLLFHSVSPLPLLLAGPLAQARHSL
ncbi:unnamed protein product [Closterium sp. NIES-54]